MLLKKVYRFSFAACLMAFFFLGKVEAETPDFANTPKLVVRGEGSVFKPADQMRVTLGVVTGAADSSQALNENNQKMQQVISHLKAIGLDASDYRTGRFHVQPIYGKHPDESKIVSYDATNTILIETQKINLADKIIDAAVKGGANQIQQVNFSLNNPQSYFEGAIQVATENAQLNARALAQAAGVRLGRVLSLSSDQTQSFPPPFIYARGMSSQESQTPLEAGNVEVHATVQATFEIAPQD